MSFTIEQIKEASRRVRDWIETNKELPNYVTIAGIKVNIQDYLYLAVNTLILIHEGLTCQLELKNFAGPIAPKDNIIPGNIPKNEYLKIAYDIKKHMNEANKAPDYAYGTGLGTYLGYHNLVYMYSMILDYLFTSGNMANYAVMNPWSQITGQTEIVKGKWWKAFEDEMKVSVTSILDVYNHLADYGAKYGFYYEDKNSNADVLEGLNPNDTNFTLDPNCTDIAQLLYRISRNLGFNKWDPNNPNKSPAVRFVRAEVFCGENWYGHIFIEVIGGGFPEWTIIDGSAKLRHNYPAGMLICTGGVRNRSYDPAWLLEAADYSN